MGDMLSLGLKKVKGSNKVYKEMKEDVSTLNNIITSRFVSIKQSETQIGQIYSHFNQREKGDPPSDTLENFKNYS